jgi:hypothetical protein
MTSKQAQASASHGNKPGCAKILFQTDKWKITVAENPKTLDEPLRKLIETTCKRFFKAYRELDRKEAEGAATQGERS